MAMDGQIKIIPPTIGQSHEQAVFNMFLQGHSLTRHDAAGEATRLGLGTKYVLTPQQLVDSLLADSAMAAQVERLRSEGIITPDNGTNLYPISMGERHMLQTALKFRNMGLETGEDILGNQYNLVIMNEATSDEIVQGFADHSYFGFDPEKCLFMTQSPYHGFNIADGSVYYDYKSPKHLYNHGAMVMQLMMDGQVFTFLNSERWHMSRADFRLILKQMMHMIAYNIEDYGYLIDEGFDNNAIASALDARRAGYSMVMELVGQKSPPQSGGFWGRDSLANADIVIESDSAGISKALYPDEFQAFISGISLLNKNFNQYLNPLDVMDAVLAYGFPIHLKAQDGALYPQPPQGDINFLVPTAFCRRTIIPPITGIKEKADIPPGLTAFAAQDRMPGFAELAQEYGFIR
ncbi:MAG: hypothetical protein WC490_05100 [Candidatus Margulisiibacteriota bacterium]